VFSIASFSVESSISRAEIAAADPCRGGNRMKPPASHYAMMVAVK
jgi:hypothetical protein